MREIFLAKGPVSVRPLAPEDAPLLLKWLTDPAVLEWYEGRDKVFTPETVREHFYDPFPGQRCLVRWEETPIGYVQVYPLDAEGLLEYSHPGPGAFAADQFIGEPVFWGRGIGRAFLSLIAEHLLIEENARCVLLDPRVSNLRAIRCYEACGFRRVKLLPRHELHEGVWEDCWLMEYPPSGRRFPADDMLRTL